MLTNCRVTYILYTDSWAHFACSNLWLFPYRASVLRDIANEQYPSCHPTRCEGRHITFYERVYLPWTCFVMYFLRSTISMAFLLGDRYSHVVHLKWSHNYKKLIILYMKRQNARGVHSWKPIEQRDYTGFICTIIYPANQISHSAGSTIFTFISCQVDWCKGHCFSRCNPNRLYHWRILGILVAFMLVNLPR